MQTVVLFDLWVIAYLRERGIHPVSFRPGHLVGFCYDDPSGTVTAALTDWQDRTATVNGPDYAKAVRTTRDLARQYRTEA